MGTESLQNHLQDRVDDRFRGMFKYDSAGVRTEYLRDDIKADRMQSQFDRIKQRLAPEATSNEQTAFLADDLHATLRYFDEAIVLHFPTSQHDGVVVSLEPDVARQFNSFVNDCIQELHTFRRGKTRKNFHNSCCKTVFQSLIRNWVCGFGK